MQLLHNKKYVNASGIYRNFIDGQWLDIDSGQTFSDINPADTRQVLAVFPKATRDVVGEAVDAAAAAHEKWAEVSGPDRSKVLFKVSELLEKEREQMATLLTTEEGKTLTESIGEIDRAISVFRFFSGLGFRIYGQTIPSVDPSLLLYTRREPLGVVSVITPWNYPVLISSWKIAPAIVSGNTVVFKPASYTPLVTLRLVEVLERAGLPRGVVNFVTGSGAALGEELVKNPKVAAVTFTGSCEVGSMIHQASSSRSSMMRIQLEMGGKNPTVIMNDADLDNAVEVVAKGAFGVTGQSCSATERVIAHKDIFDKFLRMLIERAAKIRIGNGLEQGIEMGPLVGETERRKVLGYYELGRVEGAKVAYGGNKLHGGKYEHGAFVEPTIFTDVSPNMRIAQEEIFGPVVAMFTFSSLEEAVELANGVEFGLLSSICTTNLRTAQEFVKRIKAGVVRVNRPTTGVEAQAPFGGVKKSGTDIYKELGDTALDYYARTKTVYLGF
jgi:acyl-CoA reductase-like NAD-dependent aldehyde dehydrogenase